MDILQNIIAEEDVQYMPESLLTTFGNVLDESLGKCFLQYLQNPEADQSVVAKIKECMEDKIDAVTFHTYVLESGVRDTVGSLQLETLPYQPVNLDHIIDTMAWVRENRGRMTAFIEPRTTAKFKSLITACKKYDDMVQAYGYPVKYENLTERVQVNKKLFYRPQEKPSPTRIGLIIKRERDCDIAYKGATYLKYCSENRILGYRRTEF